MISVNGKPVEFTTFPDKTSSARFEAILSDYLIEWRYDGDHECILLWYLVHHIRENEGQSVNIVLYMPYIPNARMDRVKNKDEIFTLKWFSEFINSLGLYRVVVLDPHSNVATALIDRVEVVNAVKYVGDVVNVLNNGGYIWTCCFATRTRVPRNATQNRFTVTMCLESSTVTGEPGRLKAWN